MSEGALPSSPPPQIRPCTCDRGEVLTSDIGNLAVLVEVAEEEAVDERGLAQPGLAHHQQREVEAPLDGLAVHLLGERREADVVSAVWLEQGGARLEREAFRPCSSQSSSQKYYLFSIYFTKKR